MSKIKIYDPKDGRLRNHVLEMSAIVGMAMSELEDVYDNYKENFPHRLYADFEASYNQLTQLHDNIHEWLSEDHRAPSVCYCDEIQYCDVCNPPAPTDGEEKPDMMKHVDYWERIEASNIDPAPTDDKEIE